MSMGGVERGAPPSPHRATEHAMMKPYALVAAAVDRVSGAAPRGAAVTWRSELDEVRRLHRELRGWYPGMQDPWDPVVLIPNLRALAEQGYTLNDIGVMLGVSQERVRQLYAQYGVSRPYRGVTGRLWHEATARFVPVRAKAKCAVVRRQCRHRRTEQIAEDQRRMADTLKTLAQELGRTPTLQEFAGRWAGRVVERYRVGPLIRLRWFHSAKRGYGEATKALYTAAGLMVRALGGPGHRAGSPT